jgi:hypothetical protein
MQAGVIRAAGGRAKGKVGERGRVRKGGAKDEKRKGREGSGCHRYIKKAGAE